MEPFRELKGGMERETAKGSAPLVFERLEFPDRPYQPITSEEKLDMTLAYLLRARGFSQYAGKTVINNVYMDLDFFCRNPQFKRVRFGMDRESVYARVQRYKKKLEPDYDGRLYLETVRCIFSLPEGEAEKYRVVYKGQEAYAFIMSDKYILDLFACCETARKTAAWDGVEYGHLSADEQKIVRLEGVRDMLFQALLFDDVEYKDGRLYANLHTVYCLEGPA